MDMQAWQDRLFTMAPYLAAVAAGFMALGLIMPGTPRPSDVATHRTYDTMTLVVFETESCIYCKRFKEDIAPGYVHSSYAARAPLRTLHVSEQSSAGYQLRGYISTVPTFVLIGRDGREIDRIRGYPGRDRFYPKLDEVLAKAPRA